MSKYTLKKNIDQEEWDKRVNASNKRIKEVQDKAKIDPIDLLRKFDY